MLTALAAAAVLRAARAARRTGARVARLEGWGVAASGFGDVGTVNKHTTHYRRVFNRAVAQAH